MPDKPIMFSAPMVRALLAGTKTQTRRVVKGVAREWLEGSGFTPEFTADPANGLCPSGVPGDTLWVKEAFSHWADEATKAALRATHPCLYRADYAPTAPALEIGGYRWLAPLFMPRWASRITLLVKSVRVERVQEISYNDAIAEGWHPGCGQGADFWFEELWDSINGKKHPWASNPWVWVIEFERKQPNA